MGRPQGALARKYAGMTLTERVHSRCLPEPGPLPTPCMIWQGAVGSHGYGHLHVPEAGTVLAHVAAWTGVHGPVPAGLELDHVCARKRCAEPSHLEPVTHSENMLRWAARRRLAPAPAFV